MKRRSDPHILVPLAALAAVVIAWAAVSPAVAAATGAVAVLACLLLALLRNEELGGLTRSLRRAALAERGASMPLRPSSAIGPLASAASELVTALAHTREALAGERLRRRILEEALREGLVILDGHQRVMAANAIAARMLGFDLAASRGRLLQECTRCPNLNAALSRAFEAGGRHACDLDPPGAPGLVCEAVIACVSDEGGHLAGALLLLRDVTAERSLERMRTDFAANVSHELRTPITNIRGYVETLLQVGLEDPAMSQRFLEIVHRNASRLGALVEDLLSLSFVESPTSRERIEMAPVPVERLFEWVEAELGPAAEARGIRLVRAGDPNLQVHANTLLAEQALGNLVSNAIRYTHDHTDIEVGARSDGEWVALTVRDHGPGIPERHLPRLFERFYRVESSRAREGGGTGLGLAIVKHIAMVHGGTIEVHSATGEGSTFTLRLPAVDRAGSPPSAATDAF